MTAETQTFKLKKGDTITIPIVDVEGNTLRIYIEALKGSCELKVDSNIEEFVAIAMRRK